MDNAKLKEALALMASAIATLASRVPNGPEVASMTLAVEAALLSDLPPGSNDLQNASA